MMNVLAAIWAFLASDSTGKHESRNNQAPGALNTAKRFADDDRGVMMVVGAVSGAFLIGAVWYIWGVGQAAVFRENMQSAADATAYQVSVYDARGMNIIAMINLIMSVVLTVYVVIRFLQAIFIAVNIVSCIFGAIFNPVCDATTLAEPEVTEFVEAAARVDAAILTALSVTESGISLLWPVFASGTSMAVSNDYSPTVNKTIGIGSSLNPLQGLADGAAQLGGSAIDLSGKDEEGNPVKAVSAQNIKKNFGGKGGFFCNFDGKFMLPTQNDDYANLCGRAGANVVYAIGGLVSLFAGLLPGGSIFAGALSSLFDSIAGMVASLVAKFEAFFCEDDAGSLMKIAEMLVSGSGNGDPEAGLNAQCDKKAKAENSKKDGPGGDVAAATKKCKDTLNRAKKGSKGTDKATGAFAEACSKTLYSGSDMLGQDFQNWGFSYGSYSDRSGAIVSTANGKGGGGVGATGANGADFQVAQSEFYYEPKSAGESQDAETSALGKDNYMWNMRWRARLRKVKAPTLEIGNMLGGILTKAGSKAGGTAQNPNVGKAIDKSTGFISGLLSGKGNITIGSDNASMVH